MQKCYDERMTRGFTLAEMLIVVAILAIVSFVAVGFVSNSVPRNQLQTEADALLGMVRRAQERTVNGYASGVWGVHVQAGTATLFLGEAFTTRDVAYDEARTFPVALTPSGSADVVFEIRSGAPTAPAAFTLTDQATSLFRTITIHASGSIESS